MENALGVIAEGGELAFIAERGRNKGDATARITACVFSSYGRRLPHDQPNLVVDLDCGRDLSVKHFCGICQCRGILLTVLMADLLSDGAVNELLVALRRRGLGMREHALRVASIAGAIAAAMKLADSEIRDVALGGLLHEVGKLDVPDAILFKPGKLNDDEMRVMRTYPYLGYERVRNVLCLASAAPILYAHREKFDGSGYPRGLKGEEIPLGARIVAVTCAFDTFVSDRPHHLGHAVNYARAQVARWSGSDFDPRIVEICSAFSLNAMPAGLSHVSSDIRHRTRKGRESKKKMVGCI